MKIFLLNFKIENMKNIQEFSNQIKIKSFQSMKLHNLGL